MQRLNFVKEGQGPTIVLSHALGCDLGMWDEVAGQLARSFTVLRYDQPGHGKSESCIGSCTIEDMADHAAALIAQEVDGPVHFVGISLGGMVAQQLAVRHPELVSSIVVANTSSSFDDTARGLWRARAETALNLGMSIIANGALARWFTPEFRRDPLNAARLAELRRVIEATPPRVYQDGCNVVARIELWRTNSHIACPALVIAGTRDEATPPQMAQVICQAISGAEFASIEAAHLSAVEQPVAFANLVMEFVRRL